MSSRIQAVSDLVSEVRHSHGFSTGAGQTYDFERAERAETEFLRKIREFERETHNTAVTEIADWFAQVERIETKMDGDIKRRSLVESVRAFRKEVEEG